MSVSLKADQHLDLVPVRIDYSIKWNKESCGGREDGYRAVSVHADHDGYLLTEKVEPTSPYQSPNIG